MKIQVNKTVSEEVEITLPYFFKNICYWVAVLNDTQSIVILDYPLSKEIKLEESQSVLNRFSNTPVINIESQEFFAKYDEINEKFNNTISTWKQKK